MSIHYTINKELEQIRVVADGQINENASIQTMFTVTADPEFESTYDIVVDLRNVVYKPTSTGLQRLSDIIVVLRNKIKGEIVLIVSDSNLYLAKLLCMMVNAAGMRIKAVTKYDDN